MTGGTSATPVKEETVSNEHFRRAHSQTISSFTSAPLGNNPNDYERTRVPE
jgi:hypothetical protein